MKEPYKIHQFESEFSTSDNFFRTLSSLTRMKPFRVRLERTPSYNELITPHQIL